MPTKTFFSFTRDARDASARAAKQVMVEGVVILDKDGDGKLTRADLACFDGLLSRAKRPVFRCFAPARKRARHIQDELGTELCLF